MEVKTPEDIKHDLHVLFNRYESEQQELLEQLDKSERDQIGVPIKGVHQLNEFKANGVKYLVRKTLTIERFIKYEEYQVSVGFGLDFKSLYHNMAKSYSAMNAGKLADASVLVHNMMSGIKDQLEDREHVILALCALYICREDEDVTKFDPALMTQKINDWKAEGIAMESFFKLAFSLVNEFTPIYEEVLENISESLKSVKEENQKLSPLV